jgi:hypothetical protein
MTPLLISFNVKRKQGDTIHIVERDVLQINDSIVINVDIPEMYEECDSTHGDRNEVNPKVWTD